MSNYKSKTLATWLALLLGGFGLHRFYLHGLKDRWAWLFPAPTLLGLYGLQRMELLGQDDRLSWLLMPLLGLALAAAMLGGIIYGLTPDEKWNAQRNPGQPARASGWINVIGVVVCLLIGGAVLMTTIAFSAQRYFETQAEAAQELSQ
ncbi:hypothetical protein G8A07_17615 [Roseateles sp. DAIF2]|uniref:NINE protein n=1 Tax=Roseateles sp. DAIF2 TaxID=2714952 RepID=UPI0018A2C878|nr:NINE protein [Roseateles sp. DAIF2]QPF74553.1 hypothetical protein G8A07_17615 [Roseateles sp. DAIF2]